MNYETLRKIVEEEVFTISEAAGYLNLTRQLVSRQAILGKIPTIRGKLILKEDLDKYAKTFKGTRKKFLNE